MAAPKSFSKIEQDVRHKYRNNLNIADSTEDVKKFFVYAVQDFIQQAFDGRVIVAFEDIRIDQKTKEGFVCSNALKKNPEFLEGLETTDLPQIIERLAENAIHHLKHLESKHPDKTEAKIYPTASHSGRFHTSPPAKKGR